MASTNTWAAASRGCPSRALPLSAVSAASALALRRAMRGLGGDRGDLSDYLAQGVLALAETTSLYPSGATLVGASGRSFHLSPGPEVYTLALPAKQGEELDWVVTDSAEPVRHPGVELGRFSG